MQVFEILTYNLKDVKFKDNINYFDDLLKASHVNYTDIMFCFNGDLGGNVCKKLIKMFPQFSEYVQYLEESKRFYKSVPDYCFSSIKNFNGQIQKYIKAEQKDDFSALLKKIPNTINFGFMGVVLDNINWYKNEFQKPVFHSNSEKIDYYDHLFNPYYSNSIRFFKEFDYGNKINLVEIVIERKILKNELEPYPDSFKEILLKLGTPTQSRLKCIFNKTENKKWLNASKTFESFMEEKSNKIGFFHNSNCLNIDEEYLINSVTPASGFSPKTIFTKIAKTKEFKYCFCKNGTYRYQFKNSYNHIFTVELMNIPFSSFFVASIRVEGYNFLHTVCVIRREAIKDSFKAKTYAEEVFSVATRVKNEYSEKLLFLYGHTPKWYAK